MPGIDRIYDKIIADAEERAGLRLSETSSKIQSMKSVVDERIEEYRKVKISEAEKEAKGIVSRAQANRRLEGKKQLLAVKQEMVTEVFEKTQQALINLSNAEKLTLYTKLIRNCLKEGHNEVSLNGKDKKAFGDKLIQNIESALGPDISVALSGQDIPDDFGVIVKNGKIYSNSTFSSMLKYMKQNIEADVMKILFKRGVEV